MPHFRTAPAVLGAQWSGLVTTIACRMLEQGEADAVVCVGSEVGLKDRNQHMIASRPAQALSTEPNSER